MSVLIKGFPLPNNCGACPLRLAWCRERIYMVTRPERCPLVPVPPHGRMIDADALKTMWDDEVTRMLEKGIEYLDYHVDTLFSDFKHDVDKMPTIIPAEEGE